MDYCHVKKQCLLIRLPGEIDHFQAEEIRKECEYACLRSLVRDIIFDFSDTNFMDSSGIGLIMGRVSWLEPIKGRVFLFGGNPMIRKMWEMAGIMSYCVILNTVEEMKEVYQ